MTVEQIMTKKLFTLTPDHPLDLATSMMGWKNIRHIPIVDLQDKLQGMLSHRDILRGAVSSLTQISKEDRIRHLKSIKVKDLMNTKPICVSQGTTLKEAAQIMRTNKISCLPVTDPHNKLLGIITEADFLTLAWEKNIIQK